MLNNYPLRDEPGKTMFVFEKNGKVFGHIIKDRTEKSPAKMIFETQKYIQSTNKRLTSRRRPTDVKSGFLLDTSEKIAAAIHNQAPVKYG
ncbi:hypothetical protein [Cohnella endophytica]|uniref:hypothetical protein n=1 Tax=Cohnella endophytica TaxID=2419778 RepID=UPI0018F3ECB2|nr:hypothetical protein [Cohnella endophytica]